MKRHVIASALGGLAALFAVTAATLTKANAADSPPDPAAAADSTIDRLRNKVFDLRIGFIDAARRVETAPPISKMPHVRRRRHARETACYSLSTSASFTFDYGPGPLSMPLAQIEKIPARKENGALVPDGLQGQYFPDLRAFLKTADPLYVDIGYKNVEVPPTHLGCAARPEALRDMQRRMNIALSIALEDRIGQRMGQDVPRRQPATPAPTAPAPI